jgi:hypothetical protein
LRFGFGLDNFRNILLETKYRLQIAEKSATKGRLHLKFLGKGNEVIQYLP